MVNPAPISARRTLFLFCAMFATAQTWGAPREYVELPQQSLASALQSVGAAMGVAVVFDPAVVGQRTAPAIRGDYAAYDAFGALLQDSGLELQQSSAGAYVVAAASAASPATAAPAGDSVLAAAQQNESASQKVRMQSATVEEIIVTAQKREERLQDVPIAISVLTADYLETRDITSIDKLSTLAPSLKIEQANNSTFSMISMRGKGALGTALFNEPSVGLYVDGVYVPKAQGSIFDIADLERIEVLRGPQGTLYGRNTIAGAVNLITRPPSGALGGSVDMSYGNYDYQRLRAILNLPELGAISAKLSGLVARRDGITDIERNPFSNVTTAGPRFQSKVYDQDSKSGAFQLRAEPADWTTFDYRFDLSIVDQAPPQYQTVGVASGGIYDPNSPRYDTPFIGGSTFPADLYVKSRRRAHRLSIDRDTREYAKNTSHAFTARFTLAELGELKSITAHREMRLEDRLDLDGTPLPLAHTERKTDYRAFSQELQLVGDYSQGRYTAGIYYFDDKGFSDNPQSYFGGLSQTDAQSGFATKSYAVYATVDFAISESLTATGGLRYTRERKIVDRFLKTGRNVLIDAPRGAIDPARYNKLSPTAILTYEVTPELNIYAKYSQGYRSGGFNADATTLADVITPFKPETVDAYEVGLKSQLFDRRVQLNLAAFWNEFDDMQLTVFRGETSATSNIINAGKSRIRGVEAEIAAWATDDVLLQLAVAYTDPKYQEYFDRGFNVASNRAFPNAPKHTASASLDWTVWRNDSSTARLVVDVSYMSKYFTYPYPLAPAAGENNAHNTESPGRTIVDARAIVGGLKVGGMNAELSLWGSNLLDEDRPRHFIDFGAGFGGLTIAGFPEPRTYGVTLGVKY